MARLTLVDLFSGCGGMTRGFEDSGAFRSVFAVEFDRDAATTYAANFGDHVACGPIEDVAVVPGGRRGDRRAALPGVLPLNRAAVGFERRGLWREYLRALEAVEPQAFVMENVPELLRSAEFVEFQRRAEELGFEVEAEILNAADFGVPQRRRRAIVIGTRSGSVPWPSPPTPSPALRRLSPRGLPTAKGRPRQRPAAHLGPPSARQSTAYPLQPDGKRWHRPRNPRPESVRRYKAVPRDGGDRFAMQRNLDRAGLGDLVPRCWREKPRGTTDVFGRLWWDRPALTIRTEFYKPEKGRYLHPSAHRPITVREAARLMSFPDDFVLPEDQAMSSIARQVGNAVPPLLARRIAESLAASLRATPRQLFLLPEGSAKGTAQRWRPSDSRTAASTRSAAGSISSCSQMRTTVQPAAARRAFTFASRSWLRASLSCQKASLERGIVPCSGQECQKQPST